MQVENKLEWPWGDIRRVSIHVSLHNPTLTDFSLFIYSVEKIRLLIYLILRHFFCKHCRFDEIGEGRISGAKLNIEFPEEIYDVGLNHLIGVEECR